MKENVFFSIVMPVYNAELYLKKSIESIVNQTFLNWELIIIDDCSDDNSYKLCKIFSEQDDRIILLRNDINQGVSATRNKGMEHASGKYLTFIDSDDYVDIDLLDEIYNELEKEKVDCLKYGCIEEYMDKKNKNVVYKRYCIEQTQLIKNKKDIISKCIDLETIPLFGYTCNTFYMIDIIKQNKLKFDMNYRVNEDFAFNVEYFKLITSFKFLNKCAYHYIKRNNNSLSTVQKDDYYDLHMMKINKFLTMINDFDVASSKNMTNIFWLYVRFVYSTIERALNKNKLSYSEIIQKIKSDKLYHEFLNVKFIGLNKKQKIMIEILKSNNKIILLLLVRFISKIRKYSSNIFIKMKK